MNENIPTMEGGRMGREGKHHLGLVGKTALERESVPQSKALNHLQCPGSHSQPWGCWMDLQSKIQGLCLAGGHTGSRMAPSPAPVCGLPSASGHAQEEALEPPSPSLLGDVDSGLWDFWSITICQLPAGGWRLSPPTVLFEPLINCGNSSVFLQNQSEPSLGTNSLGLGTS